MYKSLQQQHELYFYFNYSCFSCYQMGFILDANPANMCVACLRTQVDITEGIPKQVNILC